MPLDFVVNETDVIKDITECMIENIDKMMQELGRKWEEDALQIKKSWKKQNEMGPSISNVSAVKEVI